MTIIFDLNFKSKDTNNLNRHFVSVYIIVSTVRIFKKDNKYDSEKFVMMLRLQILLSESLMKKTNKLLIIMIKDLFNK